MFSRGSDKPQKKNVVVGTPSNQQQAKAQSDFDKYVALQIFQEIAKDANEHASHKTKELAL